MKVVRAEPQVLIDFCLNCRRPECSKGECDKYRMARKVFELGGVPTWPPRIVEEVGGLKEGHKCFRYPYGTDLVDRVFCIRVECEKEGKKCVHV